MHKLPISIFLLLVIPILNSNLSAASTRPQNNVLTEETVRSFIRPEALLQYPLNHSFLYDILTKESLPYLRLGTVNRISSDIHIKNIKTLLKCLFDKGFNPYAPVRYYDSRLGIDIEQTPISFIASPNFDQSTFIKKMIAQRFSEPFFWEYYIERREGITVGMDEDPEKVAVRILAHWKDELITFLLNYQEPPLNLQKQKQTNIVIANQNYHLSFPEGVDQIIGSYTGLSIPPNFDAIDTYGHTALDYHPSEDDGLHKKLKEHGASHCHHPASAPWYHIDRNALPWPRLSDDHSPSQPTYLETFNKYILPEIIFNILISVIIKQSKESRRKPKHGALKSNPSVSNHDDKEPFTLTPLEEAEFKRNLADKNLE